MSILLNVRKVVCQLEVLIPNQTCKRIGLDLGIEREIALAEIPSFPRLRYDPSIPPR